MLEERLADIFSVFGQYRQKIDLIQSSAVNLSLCVDDSRYLERVVDALQTEFRVVYNRDMELLTIRGYETQITYDRYAEAEGVFLVQKNAPHGSHRPKRKPLTIRNPEFSRACHPAACRRTPHANRKLRTDSLPEKDPASAEHAGRAIVPATAVRAEPVGFALYIISTQLMNG